MILRNKRPKESFGACFGVCQLYEYNSAWPGARYWVLQTAFGRHSGDMDSLWSAVARAKYLRPWPLGEVQCLVNGIREDRQAASFAVDLLVASQRVSRVEDVLN